MPTAWASTTANALRQPSATLDGARARWRDTGVILGSAWIVGASILCFLWFPILRYPDTGVYADMAARLDVTDPAFWTASPRPVGYPLVLAVVGQEAVVFLQYALFAGVVCLMLARLGRDVGTLGCVAIAAALGSSHVLYWSSAVLTESLSVALFLYLFLASDGYRRADPLALALWCALAVFWSLLRDTNALFAVGFLLVAALYPWVDGSGGPKRLRVAAMLATAVVVSLAAAVSNGGDRWQFPMVNNLAQRILPDPEATRFMVERGLAITPAVACYRGRWAYECGGDLTVFGDFLASGRAQGAYAAWLASAPLDRLRDYATFLADYRPVQYVVPEAQLPPKAAILDAFLPQGRVFAALVALGLVLSAVGSRRDRRLLHATVLQLGLLATGLVAFWGDALETNRHVFVSYVGLVAVSLAVVAKTLKRLRPGRPADPP